MLANIMLFEGKSQEAIDSFKDIKSDNYRALAKLIHLFRRTGKLADAKAFIEKVEKNANKKSDAGLSYARGLFKRYIGDPQGALRDLNAARFDGFYGVDALILMVEIYFNPHDEIIYSSQNKEATYAIDAENQRAAETLIEKLQLRNYDTTILECYGMLHTGKKAMIDKAVKIIHEMYKKNKEYIPVLKALAFGKFL